MSTIMVVDIESMHGSARAARRATAGDQHSVVADRRTRGSSQPSPEVQLTRRGRLVLLVAVLGAVFAVLTMLSAPAASTGQTRHSSAHTVVVEPGQTLWDIAASSAPGEDPRDVIAQIVDLNSLPDSGSIRVGQPLYIPDR